MWDCGSEIYINRTAAITDLGKECNKHTSGFILLQAYKKLSLFMAILAKQIMTFL